MGIQFVHRRMVTIEAQISYTQSLYYSLPIALVTKMISKNEHSRVSKASGQPLWLHGTEAIWGKIHWKNFFRERMWSCVETHGPKERWESQVASRMEEESSGEPHNRTTDLLSSHLLQYLLELQRCSVSSTWWRNSEWPALNLEAQLNEAKSGTFTKNIKK